jgi:hypothetical protein
MFTSQNSSPRSGRKSFLRENCKLKEIMFSILGTFHGSHVIERALKDCLIYKMHALLHK